MKFNKVFCLFEQSGTFKNAFEKMGFEAVDYDIQVTEHTGKSTDIFKEIYVCFYHLDITLFDKISKNDLVMAFFPCTYFSDQSQLLSRGDSFGQKEWSLSRKLEYSLCQMGERSEYYENLCMLCHIAIEKGFKLVIENPYGKANFLKQFFPIKPTVIITDRTLYGDYFKKPTQFFFINCKPSFQLERQIRLPKEKRKIVENEHGFSRSKISPDFAKNFITDFILE